MEVQYSEIPVIPRGSPGIFNKDIRLKLEVLRSAAIRSVLNGK